LTRGLSAMQAEYALDQDAAPIVGAAIGLDGIDDAASTFLTFDLDGQTFAVTVLSVREILDTQPVTRLPNSPHDMHGVIDVRGSSVPIVDLTARLGMGAFDEGPDTRVVVFEIQQKGHDSRTVGVLAERVRDVCRIESCEIEDAPSTGDAGISSDLILGLCRRDGSLVVVVDLARVFMGQALGLEY